MNSRLALLWCVVVASALTFACSSSKSTIEERSEQVMPFDMNQAMHVFTPTKTGGVQAVVVHNANEQQISLVRQHLQQQAVAFAKGDFSNPAYVHGNDMPGLNELERDYSHMTVAYANTTLGAKIVYTSADPKVVAAIHEWFRAQVHDHGSHATMNM
jgi:hypothetical protein